MRFPGITIVTNPPSPPSVPPVITGLDALPNILIPLNLTPEGLLAFLDYINESWLEYEEENGTQTIRGNDPNTPRGQRFGVDCVLTAKQPAKFLYLDDGSGDGTKAWFPASGMATAAGSTEHLSFSGASEVLDPDAAASFVSATGVGVKTLSLGDGSVDGFEKTIVLGAVGDGSWSIVPENFANGTSVSVPGRGAVTFMWDGDEEEWNLVSSQSGTLH